MAQQMNPSLLLMDTPHQHSFFDYKHSYNVSKNVAMAMEKINVHKTKSTFTFQI